MFTLPQARSTVWRLGVSSVPEKARWVLVGLHTGKSGNKERNVAIFYHCNLTNMQVCLNHSRYPSADAANMYVCGDLLKLLSNYQSNRKQPVVLNEFESEWGSRVLGPLLSLIYINDLEKGIKSQIKFFVEDTSFFSIVTDPSLSAAEQNQDLKLIENCAFQWKMSFNPDPNTQATELIFFN